MRRPPPEVVTFTVADLGAVVAEMATLVPREGWLTLQPAFDAESAPAPRRSSGFFTSRGPHIPVANWVPGERTRQGIDYIAVGVQHGAGSKVLDLLAERGHVLPTGWESIDDHPGSGLVVAVPPAADHAEVLGWLLDTADHLCPVQLTGEWRASIHRR